MTDTPAAETFAPGEYIREELEARGWTQTDLAEILGRPFRVVNEIIGGKRRITPETAKGLSDAFGTTPQLWLNLEATHQLAQIDAPDRDVARRALLYTMAPIKPMVKRRWIEHSDDAEILEQRLVEFFEINDMSETPEFWTHAARKSTQYGEVTPEQLAWLFRARQLASAIPVKSFSASKLEKATGELRIAAEHIEEIRRVPTILAEAGVRLLIVEPLPMSRIDGACFWLTRRSPVVVLSLRFDRLDYFWHTLMHELGHVYNRDGLDNDHRALDLNLLSPSNVDPDERPEFEQAADEFAVAALISQDSLDDFILRTKPLYAKKKIRAFAKLAQVHPGIIVGQLQHRGEISYAHSREMLEKVRSVITQVTLTDGWGQELPSTV